MELVIAVASALVAGVIFLITRSLLERQKRRVAGRAAARLVENEFSTANSLIELSLAKGVWMDDPTAILSTAQWEEHRAALAAAPRFKGWHAVSSAPDHLRDIHRRAEAAGVQRGSKVGPGDLSPDYLGLFLIDSEIALDALRDYAKTPSYKSERVKELQVLLNEILPEMESAMIEPTHHRTPRETRKAKRRSAKKARQKNR